MSELATNTNVSVAEVPASALTSTLSLSAISWSTFEGGRNPYIILVLIYVYMPYFTTVVVGDAVRGQALIADLNLWAGLVVAATAPFLGATIDRIGPREPWLGAVVALAVPLIISLWWCKPDHSGISTWQVALIAAGIAVLLSYSEVLHNSMLIHAAGLNRAHAASGLALSLGNLVSVSALLFVLWAFACPAQRRGASFPPSLSSASARQLTSPIVSSPRWRPSFGLSAPCRCFYLPVMRPAASSLFGKAFVRAAHPFSAC